MAIPQGSYQELSDRRKIEFLEAALCLLVREHGSADPEWVTAKLAVPCEVMVGQPKLYVGRDANSHSWVLSAYLDPVQDSRPRLVAGAAEGVRYRARCRNCGNEIYKYTLNNNKWSHENILEGCSHAVPTTGGWDYR